MSVTESERVRKDPSGVRLDRYRTESYAWRCLTAQLDPAETPFVRPDKAAEILGVDRKTLLAALAAGRRFRRPGVGPSLPDPDGLARPSGTARRPGRV